MTELDERERLVQEYGEAKVREAEKVVREDRESRELVQSLRPIKIIKPGEERRYKVIEERKESAERIAKEYGIMPQILAGWATDVEDMERLAKVVAGEKVKAVDEAVEEATNFADKADEDTIDIAVLEEANRAFNDGKITVKELEAVRKAFEAQTEGSQNPDPLARANEDFQSITRPPPEPSCKPTQPASGVGHNNIGQIGSGIMSIVESQKDDGKRGPKHKPLPQELIGKWAGEGMGGKAIASKLNSELGITVSYKTIQRTLAGERGR